VIARLVQSRRFAAAKGHPGLAGDEAAWIALKHGGKVILLRHTHVDIRERDRAFGRVRRAFAGRLPSNLFWLLSRPVKMCQQ
jgi:hypothetical protein